MRYQKKPGTSHERCALNRGGVASRWGALLALFGVVAMGAGCGGEAVPGAEDLVGDWFRCEFFDRDALDTPPADGCAMLDDDGLRFDADGLAYDIEVEDSQETGCADENAGACFPRDAVEVAITGELLGTYTMDHGHVTIVEEDGDRLEFDLVPGQDYARFVSFMEHKGDEVEEESRYAYMYRYR